MDRQIGGMDKAVGKKEQKKQQKGWNRRQKKNFQNFYNHIKSLRVNFKLYKSVIEYKVCISAKDMNMEYERLDNYGSILISFLKKK
jgi:hypothetical protein